MRTRLSLLAVLLACTAPKPQPPHGEEAFRVDGGVENAPFVFGREDLSALPRRSFEAPEPRGDRAQRRFTGIALEVLLTERMELRHEVDTVVVHGDGGVSVPVPLAILRQLRPVLADEVEGGATRGPGRLLLAWPTSDHPGIETDPRLRWWWVDGVRRLEVTRWIDRHGRALRVPAGASDEARRGADVLAAQCIGCHAVRGVGGTRGPSLTGEARPATQLRDRPATLSEHLRWASGASTAPALSTGMAKEVASFLDAVRLAGPERESASPSAPGMLPAPLDESPIAPPSPIGGRPGDR